MTTRFSDHLLTGDHASRPAANTVPDGTLYACSTHDLIYQSDTASWSTWATLTGSGLTDHTHEATGSGADGGGATLTPDTFNLPAATPASVAGQIAWHANHRAITGYDSVQAKPITPWGFAARAYPPGFDSTAAYGTAVNLAAVSGGNGGALMAPIIVTAPMFLNSYILRSTDTANARSAETRLYISRLNNTATADAISGSDTSSSQTFGIGTTTTTLSDGKHATKSIAALGSTLDLVTSWSSSSALPGLLFVGYLPDGSSLW
jgi:hypothetical protein